MVMTSEQDTLQMFLEHFENRFLIGRKKIALKLFENIIKISVCYFAPSSFIRSIPLISVPPYERRDEIRQNQSVISKVFIKEEV